MFSPCLYHVTTICFATRFVCLFCVILLSVVTSTSALQETESMELNNVTTGQKSILSFNPPPNSKHRVNISTNISPPIESRHKDLIIRQFDVAEYHPTMEVVAVGLDYDNETATVSVSVFAGIPTINGSRYSNSNASNKLLPLTENFTYYEIYLMALLQSEDDLPYPPTDCLSDSFLQHSRREVFVDGCPLASEANKSAKQDVPTATVNSAVPPFWETSCVDENANNFTAVFRHVYSGYYCLLIQPHAGTHSRRTFTRMMRYETKKNPVDITKWQTTIDLQPMPDRKCISAAFIVPNSSYEIISHQLRVDLVQVSGAMCNDSSQMKLIQSKIVTMEMGKQAADVEFVEKPPGLYCVVVTPLDERCGGNTFWKAKGGSSCSRHSAKAVQLQENVGYKQQQAVVFKSADIDTWATFLVVCATACGLVLASLLVVVVMRYQRQKKRFKRRQHQLLLVDWEPVTRVSQTESITADGSINTKYIPISFSDPDVNGKKDDTLLALLPISILLLYRRDDLQIARRATELRNRLQSECGVKIKIYDYGDESQWENIALEGLDWLPNRIYSNPSNNNDSIERVIVIHSPLSQPTSQIITNEQDGRNVKDKESGNTSNPLLINEMDNSSVSDHRSTTDPEFLYGMQLLLGYMRESGDNDWGNARRPSIYNRVFNVRFTDITDSSEKDNNGNKSLVYPNLQVAPFTCYLLPEHFNQLLQHITAP